jgi:hypothetical protein
MLLHREKHNHLTCLQVLIELNEVQKSHQRLRPNLLRTLLCLGSLWSENLRDFCEIESFRQLVHIEIKMIGFPQFHNSKSLDISRKI